MRRGLDVASIHSDAERDEIGASKAALILSGRSWASGSSPSDIAGVCEEDGNQLPDRQGIALLLV